MLQFGLIGLVLAGGLLGVLQTRPATVLPFEGTLSVQIGFPNVEFASVPSGCQSDCQATTLNLTIDSVSVHREGELNLTAGWIQISHGSTTVDVANITGSGQLIGQAPLPPGIINLVRLSISSAVASDHTWGPVQVTIPGHKIDVVLSPVAEVKSGKL